MKMLQFTFVLLVGSVLQHQHTAKADNEKNILLIVVDDLRPEIGVYKDTQTDVLYQSIDTPKLDAFANTAMTFTKAYSQYPTCAPSRASFMTGRRPLTTGVFNTVTDFRTSAPTIQSMPEYFKDTLNYTTYATGKIYHTGHDDNDKSWSEDNYQPNTAAYWQKVKFAGNSTGEADISSAPKDLPDQQVLDDALGKLKNISETAGQEPFFLAVGFKKPHLPLICPSEFFDKYDEDDVDAVDGDLKYVPEDYPDIGWNDWLDLQHYNDMKSYDNSFNNTLSDDEAKKVRRAYYACVSWIDDLIGQLLQGLEDYDLDDNTVVAIVSDHGWHLGEHSTWTKGTLYDLDLRVPWMIRVPGVTTSKKTSDEFVENVDLFPTLVEAAGWPALSACTYDTKGSSSDQAVCTEGISQYDLIDGSETTNGKSYVLSNYQTTYTVGGTSRKFMGFSIFDGEYHYIRWVKYNTNIDKTYKERIEQTTDTIEEMYDHLDNSMTVRQLHLYLRDLDYDPNETSNIEASADSVYAAAKTSMYTSLKDHYA